MGSREISDKDRVEFRAQDQAERSAFPAEFEKLERCEQGLSIRTYLAAKAVTGLSSLFYELPQDTAEERCERIGYLAAQIADATVRALVGGLLPEENL